MNTLSQAIKMWALILLSFFASLILLFLRTPPNIDWLQPLWIILVLLYWILMRPQYVSIGVAWSVGIFLDILYNTPIGENALALVLIAFLATKFRQKIISLSFWKSSMIIFGLIALYQSLQFLMQTCIGSYFNIWSIFGNAFMSTLAWILLAVFLFNHQRKIQI